MSRIQQQVVGVVLAGAAIWIALQVLKRFLVGAMWRSWLKNAPRQQPLAFVHRLRKITFDNPFATMNALWSNGRDGFVRKLWHDAGGREHLPADGLAVHRMHLHDGRAIAVITMPPPEKRGEPYVIGVVLPGDKSLKQDLRRARRMTHLFVLNRWNGSGRDTDLCGWTADGKQLTYNVGGNRDVEGFTRTVDAKLTELRR